MWVYAYVHDGPVALSIERFVRVIGGEHGPQRAPGKGLSMGRRAPVSPVVELAKAPTRIVGLDEVLHGGIPRERITLIRGGSGSGKTVMGQEFLYRAALEGEPGILVAFEEGGRNIRQNALSFGWDLESLEKAGKFFLWDVRIDRETIMSGDFTIAPLLAGIGGKARQMGAKTVMIDAIDALLRIFSDPARRLNELYSLHDWLAEQPFTTILTTKAIDKVDHGLQYEFLDYMADCVLLLDLRVCEQVTTRRLRVVKYRGSGFCSNEYPYVITSRGSVVMPITRVQLNGQPFGDYITSGNPQLDKVLGGGLRRRSNVLISGVSGTGKTTLAATFAAGACSRGEKVLYVGFEESQEMVVQAMLSPGIDLRPALKQDKLRFYTIMPEVLSPEEHLCEVDKRIEQFAPEDLVIDSISACARMGSDHAAFDFLLRLMDICRQRGITCLMTHQARSSAVTHIVGGIPVSSLTDALIQVGFKESDGQERRTLLVVKSRGAKHSHRRHDFEITDQGIQIESVKT